MRQKIFTLEVTLVGSVGALLVWFFLIEGTINWRAAGGLSWPILAVLVALISLFMPVHRVVSSLLAAVAGAAGTWWVVYQFPGANWSNFGWAWLGIAVGAGIISSALQLFPQLARLVDEHAEHSGETEEMLDGQPDNGSSLDLDEPSSSY